MRRRETQAKLNGMITSDRRMWIIATILFLIALAALAQGLYGGTDLGETTATVRWAALQEHHKTTEWFSSIRAELPSGKLVQFTSAHTPPPRAGERIVLHVRRNIFGWHSYTWQPGKTPAQ